MLKRALRVLEHAGSRAIRIGMERAPELVTEVRQLAQGAVLAQPAAPRPSMCCSALSLTILVLRSDCACMVISILRILLRMIRSEARL